MSFDSDMTGGAQLGQSGSLLSRLLGAGQEGGTSGGPTVNNPTTKKPKQKSPVATFLGSDATPQASGNMGGKTLLGA